MLEELVLNKGIHFTYKADADMTSLCQGDVLLKTDALSNILGSVHPYFLNDEYKYFMVLSQSCDLVRRGGKNCKTPYITLAAVRDYNDFVQRSLIANKMAEEYKGLLLVDDRSKIRVMQLIERLYNNTEPDYFFLYKEESLGFPNSMVCYLKVSIALKSALHYQECLEAKKLELSDEFKAKLGWLVGNMYSRVGTTDWESKMSSDSRRQMIEDDVNSRCVIGSKEQIKELKKQFEENADRISTHDEAIEYLSTVIVKSKYDKVMDIIEDTFFSGYKKINSDDKQTLLRAIKSNSRIKALIQ